MTKQYSLEITEREAERLRTALIIAADEMRKRIDQTGKSRSEAKNMQRLYLRIVEL